MEVADVLIALAVLLYARDGLFVARLCRNHPRRGESLSPIPLWQAALIVLFWPALPAYWHVVGSQLS